MIKKIPDFVMDWLKKEAKEKNTIKVDIEIYQDEAMTHLRTRGGLSFSWDLKFHGANGFKYGIEEYLLTTLNYTRKPIKIFLNNTALDAIQQPLLLPPEPLPQIDLSHT